MPRPEKSSAVAEITERFKEADAALLTEYRGLSVGELQELRRALRAADTDYKVLKNTLARLAVREVGLEDLAEHLVGPTAIAFVKGDAVAAAKALDDAAKRFPVLVVKGGVVDGVIIDADQTKALARLEPREVQLAKIAMLFNTPLQQSVNVFAALLRDLGSMLAQVVAKKESGELPGGNGGAPAAAPAEEAPAAEAATETPVEAATETPVEVEPTAEAEAGPAEAETAVAETAAETETTSAAEAEASVEAASETDSETAEGDQDKED